MDSPKGTRLALLLSLGLGMQFASSPASAAETQTYSLSCHIAAVLPAQDGSYPEMDGSFIVDLSASTVNGKSAKITGTKVAYSEPLDGAKGAAYTVVIDLQALHISSSDDGGRVILAGKCSRAVSSALALPPPVALPSTPQPQRVSEPFVLVCRMTPANSSLFFDVNFSVDQAKSIVNGNPATFSVGQISFTYGDNKQKYKGFINRISGSMIVYYGYQTVQTGNCTKADQQKF